MFGYVCADFLDNSAAGDNFHAGLAYPGPTIMV